MNRWTNNRRLCGTCGRRLTWEGANQQRRFDKENLCGMCERRAGARRLELNTSKILERWINGSK